MPLLMRYKPVNLTAEQYDDVDAKIQASDHWPPDGLLLHVCFGDEGHLLVSEIWESQEKADAFRPILTPFLEEGGISLEGPGPEVLPVHNMEVMAGARV
jgi:hypothetical protein